MFWQFGFYPERSKERWASFLRHIKTGQPCRDTQLFAYAILLR